jgi:hypothetical protein
VWSPGRFTASELKKQIAAGGRKAEFKNGVWRSPRFDEWQEPHPHREKAGTATITTANVMQSNGVIHVIDWVVTPN